MRCCFQLQEPDFFLVQLMIWRWRFIFSWTSEMIVRFLQGSLHLIHDRWGAVRVLDGRLKLAWPHALPLTRSREGVDHLRLSSRATWIAFWKLLRSISWLRRRPHRWRWAKDMRPSVTISVLWATEHLQKSQVGSRVDIRRQNRRQVTEYFIHGDLIDEGGKTSQGLKTKSSF